MCVSHEGPSLHPHPLLEVYTRAWPHLTHAPHCSHSLLKWTSDPTVDHPEASCFSQDKDKTLSRAAQTHHPPPDPTQGYLGSNSGHAGLPLLLQNLPSFLLQAWLLAPFLPRVHSDHPPIGARLTLPPSGRPFP